MKSDWLNCTFKNNPGCWFVLKGNVKEAFPFMPKFSPSLTVYIYLEVLESSLFIFLSSWTQILVFNRIFHSLALKTSIVIEFLGEVGWRTLYKWHKIFPSDLSQSLLFQGNDRHGHDYFHTPQYPSRTRFPCSIYVKFPDTNICQGQRNHNM